MNDQDILETAQKRDRERDQLHRKERYHNDPAYREKERIRCNLYRQRIKTDPERHAKYLEYHRMYYRVTMATPETREANREYQRNWKKKWYRKIKDNPEEYLKLRRLRHQRYELRVRFKVLEHYGGTPPKCACCGETRHEFLSIDHINGGGCAHRRELRKVYGSRFYNWLIKNNFPEGYQILCHNCNFAKGHYNECPHKSEKQGVSK